MLARYSGMGYAIPGTVLAIGFLPFFGWLDNNVFNSLFLLGSIGALVIGYSVRFLMIPIRSVESGISRLSPNFEYSARLLGYSPTTTFRKILLPLLNPAIISAAMLIFVDIVKELPMVLLLKPLGFETLSTVVYQESARGFYEEGIIPAMLIVLISLVPVVFFTGEFKTVKPKEAIDRIRKVSNVGTPKNSD